MMNSAMMETGTRRTPVKRVQPTGGVGRPGRRSRTGFRRGELSSLPVRSPGRSSSLATSLFTVAPVAQRGLIQIGGDEDHLAKTTRRANHHRHVLFAELHLAFHRGADAEAAIGPCRRTWPRGSALCFWHRFPTSCSCRCEPGARSGPARSGPAALRRHGGPNTPARKHTRRVYRPCGTIGPTPRSGVVRRQAGIEVRDGWSKARSYRPLRNHTTASAVGPRRSVEQRRLR